MSNGLLAPTGYNTFRQSLSEREAGPQGYNSINAVPTGNFEGQTNARGWIGNELNRQYGTPDLTERTVGELANIGNYWAKAKGSGKGASSAMGAGQITAQTMGLLLDKGVIDKNDRYNAATQDKMIEWLLFNKRPKVKAYITGKSDDEQAAVKALGQEWQAYAHDPEEGKRVLKALRQEFNI